MNPKVDEFLNRATKWQPEMKKLREIALSCGLTEEIKWGKPCYTAEDKNIVVIQGFKAYSALLFIKGYLVSDTKHILVKTGENTVVGRQARFTDVKDIVTRIEDCQPGWQRQHEKFEDKVQPAQSLATRRRRPQRTTSSSRPDKQNQPAIYARPTTRSASRSE